MAKLVGVLVTPGEAWRKSPVGLFVGSVTGDAGAYKTLQRRKQERGVSEIQKYGEQNAKQR